MTSTELPASFDAVASTSTFRSRALGVACLVGLGVFLLFALVLSGPEVTQRDAVRLFYIHVPSALVGLYLAFGITALGSIIYLRKGSEFWDLVAGASAEIGVLFCGFTLITGMLWGKPTWGVYWQWDPRLTSTTISFVLFVGYLAFRRLDLDPTVRSRRAAILGVIGFLNVLIVRQSVVWWRSLHQGSTLDPVDSQIDGLMLFSFFLGLIVFSMVFFWLLIHRFRVAWLERQIEAVRLSDAIVERQAEAGSYEGLN
jgi:heme exporter protein C